ncbi:MAG: phosphoribosylformimino-5-aminoimidazole carboxamide ribotide isomerase [Coprococcus sp.]|nr:phosphoribosylformimino-5-aminoimidazole carboxamide ribotide isomerase [Coprococcus sp.]
MKFRPCIDIHNGQVKQIVGGSLADAGNKAHENYVSLEDGAFFADLYKRSGLKGGHIILLNPVDSVFYEQDVYQAELALGTYKNGLQIGGGITSDNAERFIDMGASHVIVTSFVFKNGEINMDNLNDLVSAVGREHLVLDLSCRWKDDGYYIVTDRWQRYTNVKVNEETLAMLAESCAEYLIHAVDVEGKISGIEENIVDMLGRWGRIPMTYAGGVSSFEDLDILKKLGKNKIDVTIGSALDIFGGPMKFQDVINYMEESYEEV